MRLVPGVLKQPAVEHIGLQMRGSNFERQNAMSVFQFPLFMGKPLCRKHNKGIIGAPWKRQPPSSNNRKFADIGQV
jgi:hypothetical protein